MGTPKLLRHEGPDPPDRVLRPTIEESGAALWLRELRPNRAKFGLASSPKSRDRKVCPRDRVGRPRIADKGDGCFRSGPPVEVRSPSEDDRGAGLRDRSGRPRLDLRGPSDRVSVLRCKKDDKGAASWTRWLRPKNAK
jgi:hypothetical protein